MYLNQETYGHFIRNSIDEFYRGEMVFKAKELFIKRPHERLWVSQISSFSPCVYFAVTDVFPTYFVVRLDATHRRCLLCEGEPPAFVGVKQPFIAKVPFAALVASHMFLSQVVFETTPYTSLDGTQYKFQFFYWDQFIVMDIILLFLRGIFPDSIVDFVFRKLLEE